MLAPSLVIAALIAALAISSVIVLSGVRAYVGGESMWSKARAEAISHLFDYVQSRDLRDYVAFERALEVPLGDRLAREEMQKPDADEETILQGLLEGGNHADDVQDMVFLYRRFAQTPLFRDALDAWKRGDELISQLRTAALTLRQQIEDGQGAGAEATLRDIRELNKELQATELRFTRSLGVASRVTERLLIAVVVLTTLLLSGAGVLVMQRSLRRQAVQQKALSVMNRRWELAVAGADLGVFELNADTGDISLDAKAAQLYGLPAEPVVLHRTELRRRVAEEDRFLIEKAVDTALRTHELFKFTFRTMGPDGPPARYVETTGRLSDNGKGGDARLIGVVRDVSQDHARAQLAIDRDAAEKLAESQRTFLSRLSHELRTPLNAILGFAQLLALDRNHPLATQQQKQVRWILDAGEQLLRLVEDVLDLSKVEAGEIGMTLQPCALDAVLASSLMLVESARQRFDVEIIDRVPRPSPMAMADPKRLQQVFVNLLTNGCKYNKPGGHLVVDAYADAGEICVTFSDDGVGLSAEDAAELFQAFKRAPATSAGVDGSGLGLYIVKQLVERMHGSVGVSSQLGVGSRFTVRLPIVA